MDMLDKFNRPVIIVSPAADTFLRKGFFHPFIGFKIMMKHTILFLILIVIIGCGVKQPVNIEDTDNNTGSIYITSTPAGAEIFLDGVSTGKVTPDTLFKVPVGLHIIQLFKDGFRTITDSFNVQIQHDQLAELNVPMQAIEQFGYAQINSAPANAQIYIDNQFTGKTTPDTLQLEPGGYQIALRKNGFIQSSSPISIMRDSTIDFEQSLTINQRVLLESFANVSCQPCVKATENLLQFVEEHDPSQFAIIEYFAFWPSQYDPFYLEAPEDVDERINHYSVTTLPTLKMSGHQGVDGSDQQAISNAFNQAFQNQSQNLAISAEKKLDEGQLNVNIEIYDFDNILGSGTNRLFVAVIENDIHFDSPPGSNGLTDFEFVFRGFLTDKSGDSVEDAGTPVVKQYVLQWPSWQYSNSHIIAFIQNIDNKRILQATIN
ncbi:MAG: PEGA domain-containing protein [Caldithrix sp.]|nr:PEGA domain-containing protein [Caldithrix sp.]